MNDTANDTTMPEDEPLTEEMKARVLSIFKPPFSFSIGNIYDGSGRIVADHYTDDEPGALIRMRGWGRLTGKGGGMGLSSDEAYEIQCAAGQMFAEAFNAYWNPTAGQTAPCVPLERVEAELADCKRLKRALPQGHHDKMYYAGAIDVLEGLLQEARS